MEQIFSKTLTPTDVNSRLAIPTECLRSFGEIPEGHHSIEFTALDSQRRRWPFRLSTRTMGPHPKPVLDGRGWLAFVRDKDLKVGDGITLSREGDEANRVVTYRIQAQRTIQLMGQDIIADIP